MHKYRGIECPVCNEQFSPEDDIVVCPECGTPHHRDCYKKLNHCAKENMHGKEFFENPNDKITVPVAPCPKCKKLNPIGAAQCEECGVSLRGTDTPQTATNSDKQSVGGNYYFAGLEAEIKGESIADLNRFIGVNSIYYISKMKLNPNNNNFISWNWSAFFLTYIYFFYRKMYKAGVAFLVLMVLSFIPAILIANQLLPQALANPSLLYTFNFDFSGMENLAMLSRFTSNIPIIIAFVSGLKANSMYCSHVLIKLHNLRESASDEKEFTESIFKTGGVNMGMAITVVVVTMLLYFGVVQALTLLHM